jgi:hypothetical protein
LKKSNLQRKKIGLMLEADTAPTLEDLLNNPRPINEESLYLAALGLKFPEIRELCNKRGMAINHKPVFPFHLLNEVFEPKAEVK